MNIIEKARQYAISCHSETNHKYDGYPYEVHLQMVADAAGRYAYLIPEKDQEDFIAAAWVHDVIEDCRQTYNDVLMATNKQVAELAYALTNEKGRNRKERANEKYYAGIRACPYATLLKVCDRIANTEYSINTASRMAGMYAKELPDFVIDLGDAKYEDAFKYLSDLCRASAGNGL